MPSFSVLHRAVVALLALCVLACPMAAHASGGQVTIIEEDLGLAGPNMASTLAHLRALGAQVIRWPVRWGPIAPVNPKNTYKKPAFNAGDPASPAYNWTSLDTLVRGAAQYGLALDFDIVGGAPDWALGPGAKAVDPHSQGHRVWEPKPAELGQFFKAVALRYTGSFNPLTGAQDPGNPNDLPRIHIWSIWNEPDYGPSLAPQGLPGHLNVEYSPQMYRNMVDQAWNALQDTGHGHDTILFGELAPRGLNSWGVFSGMKPLVFLRAMYCVDTRYRPLRANAARLRGCPTTAAGSRRFPSAHPALFAATAFSEHPYMRWYTPNHEPNPDPYFHTSTADYSSLGDMGQLERSLDRLQRVYGSHKRFPIWDTEFGYITAPPHRHNDYPWVSPTTAAFYLNWAEYIHWHDSRIQSYDQYLLKDPLPALKSNDWGGFATGLITYGGRQKPTYSAYRLPLFMPVTSTKPGRSLEVWGCLRPARAAIAEGLGPQTVEIQAAPGSNPSNAAFTRITTATVRSASSCYFDTRVKFPGSGTETVRLAWSYPATDPSGYFDPLVGRGSPIYSRYVQINQR